MSDQSDMTHVLGVSIVTSRYIIVVFAENSLIIFAPARTRTFHGFVQSPINMLGMISEKNGFPKRVSHFIRDAQ